MTDKFETSLCYKEGQEDFYRGYHDHNPYEPYSYSYKEYENGYYDTKYNDEKS